MTDKDWQRPQTLLRRARRNANATALGPAQMHLSVNIFDVWVFRRRGAEAEFLLPHTSVEKATRYRK